MVGVESSDLTMKCGERCDVVQSVAALPREGRAPCSGIRLGVCLAQKSKAWHG